MRALLPGLLAVVLPFGAAQAATVTFDPAEGFHSDVREVDDFIEMGGFPNPVNVRGRWNEAGFAVDWAHQDNEPNLAVATGNFTNVAFLSDNCGGGCFDVGVAMTFARPDRRPFSLRSVGIDGTASSYLGEAVFAPYDAAGELDYDREIRQYLPVVFDNILFDAVAPGRRTATVTASSMLAGSFFAEAGQDTGLRGPGTLPIDGEMALALTDLAALRVTLGGSAGGWDDLLLDEADPIFDLVPGDCGTVCEVPGLGEFRVDVSSANVWNWGTAVGFDSFTFDVAPAPAPIPLPAGGALLLSALGALGLRARRRA